MGVEWYFESHYQGLEELVNRNLTEIKEVWFLKKDICIIVNKGLVAN